MKNLNFQIVLFFIFSTYSFCQAQTDSLKIPFISYWSKGDVYKFKVKKTEERWKDDKIIKNDSILYVAVFTVLDSTATSYKIKWSYKIDVNKTLGIKSFDNAISKLKDMDIIYTTTEVGDFTGVENWEELSNKMKEITSEILKIFPENDSENLKLKKTIQEILNIYNTKEGIETYLTKDIQLIHYPFGVEFNTEEELVYEEDLPNPFGGNPIKASSTLYFDEVDTENYRCVFFRDMKIDPEDSKKMLVDLFKKIAPETKDFKEFVKNSIFEINDSNVYDYVYNPGVPVFISNSREIIIKTKEKNERKIEQLEIELVD